MYPGYMTGPAGPEGFIMGGGGGTGGTRSAQLGARARARAGEIREVANEGTGGRGEAHARVRT